MKSKFGWLKLNPAQLTLALLASLALGGCRAETQEVELPFETIERNPTSPNTGQQYEGAAQLVVVASPADANALGQTVSLGALAGLRNLDFERQFALAAFQGAQPTDGYGAEIDRVTQFGDVITVYAHFTQRDPYVYADPAPTSPYHLVKLSREDLKGELTFVLNADGTVISEQTHVMP
ncbi:MAG: protease complex subunit PrcB family protein [Anaerolineales bacterium]